jgi:hypothetical protein
MGSITIKGEYATEILAIMDALVNRGREPDNFLDKCRIYADQASAAKASADAAVIAAAASASEARTAARNCELAEQKINEEKRICNL